MHDKILSLTFQQHASRKESIYTHHTHKFSSPKCRSTSAHQSLSINNVCAFVDIAGTGTRPTHSSPPRAPPPHRISSALPRSIRPPPDLAPSLCRPQTQLPPRVRSKIFPRGPMELLRLPRLQPQAHHRPIHGAASLLALLHLQQSGQHPVVVLPARGVPYLSRGQWGPLCAHRIRRSTRRVL